MIRNYYKAPYIQKGHGLGSIFRGVAKFFRPLARNIVNTFKQPTVRNVLKTVGKETLGTGTELLLDSIKGNDIESKLDQRIKSAKQRIVDSIEDGIITAKRAKESRKYNRLHDEESAKTLQSSNKYLKKNHSTKVGSYQRLRDNDDISTRKFRHRKKIPNVTLTNISKRRNMGYKNKTVFD